MKIAILTLPLGNNYGGIIQNYALQQVLKDMGHKAITVNRVYPKVEKSKLKKIVKNNEYLTKTINMLLSRNTLTYKNYEKINEHNRRFVNDYIICTEDIDNTQDLIRYFEKESFGAVVVGSDQVWRPMYSPCIYNYFLDFIEHDKKIKKVGYAVSFGTADWEYTEEESEVCRKLVPMFNAISVREGSGIKLCENYLNAEAILVLDPTLLLTANDYSRLIKKPKASKGLFTYILDDIDEKNSFIQKCAEQLNLKHTKSQALYEYNVKKKRKLEDLIMPPLENWLQGFRDAEFVVTDSFHGTVFSIINKKPFLTIANKERGMSRFESLLGELGLVDRLVYDANDFDANLLEKEINYTEIDEKLNVLKRESLNFLKENL